MKSEDGATAQELREMAARLLELADKLERCCTDQGQDKRVSFPGFVRDPKSAEPNSHSDTAVLAEAIHRQRQRRQQHFPKALFGEPAWDLLLDLYFRKSIGERVTVSNACIASGVPQSTALRWIDILIDLGLAVREADRDDRRKIWLVITEQGQARMHAFFSELRVQLQQNRIMVS